jgi:hypothetical protein
MWFVQKPHYEKMGSWGPDNFVIVLEYSLYHLLLTPIYETPVMGHKVTKQKFVNYWAKPYTLLENNSKF